MKLFLTPLILLILITISGPGQTNECNCYTVHDVTIAGPDSLELFLSNSCSNRAYINMYVISTIPPFDTLARWEEFGGYVPSDNIPHSSYLHTNLTIPPFYGTYKVSITNDGGNGGGIICDSLKFASTMSIHDDFINSEMKICPNPTSGKIFFFNNNAETIIIQNAIGQQVKIFDVHSEIDISELKNGLYFIDFLNSKGHVITQQKIIKQ